jgi:hypothetical protein
MSKPTYVEAFPEFQALGRGVPFLAIWKNRKSAHIDWHEGSLWDYAKFKEAIDGETMSAELEAAWEHHLPQAGRRARAVLNGGASGGACCIPHEMAEAFWNIVKRHYNQALKELATGRDRSGGVVSS